MATAWYPSEVALAIGGTFMLAAAAVFAKIVNKSLEKFFIGTGERLDALEYTQAAHEQAVKDSKREQEQAQAAHRQAVLGAMREQDSKIAMARTAEHDLRQKLGAVEATVESHSVELRKGELLMQKIEIHMEAQTNSTSRIEAMVSQIQTNLTEHLIDHAKG